MYLALLDKGVFRSDDAGKRWTPLNSGLANKKITAATLIGNSIFVGTTQGLYRLDSGIWKQMSVDPNRAVHSLVVSGNNLYVATGSNFLGYAPLKSKKMSPRKIYRTSDIGITWTEITPIHESFMKKVKDVNRTKLIANGKTLLVLDRPAFRSRDRGQTWTNLGYDTNLRKNDSSFSLAVNENTFYKVDVYGIQHTTDSGTSWYPLMDGIIGAKVQEVIVFNNRLYMYTGSYIYESSTNGKSCKSVDFDYSDFDDSKFIPKLKGHLIPQSNLHINSTLVIVNKSLYIITPQDEELHIFRLRPGEVVFSLVQKINLRELWTNSDAAKTIFISDVEKKNSNSKNNKQIVYVEYKNRLYKLDFNRLEFRETRLTDTAKQHNWNIERGFKLAGSAQTIYV